MYNFPKKRKLFDDLAAEIDSRQAVSIIGLRRTGKTTLIKQLIDHLIETGKAKRENILFYSFDEEQPKIESVIHEYETLTGNEILHKKDVTYIFLDEIQKLENWQNQIKYYYDNYLNMKFFITGSASLFIKRQTLESLAGRIYEFTLAPLSFEEFLIFRDNADLLDKKDLFCEAIKKEFAAYQKRQFVEIVNESDERIANYTKTMIEKIVYQDIPKNFPIEHEELLLRILKIIASNPGMLSDYEALSNEIGISRVTLSNYFFYLEQSFLVKKIYNFSRNMLTSEKKMKKFYLSTTSFFPFLNPGIDESKLVENLVVAVLDAKFFWRTPQKYEVDVITEKNGELLPIEVKYKETIAKKDVKNLLRFCTKFNAKKALIITRWQEKKEELEIEKDKIVEIEYVPVWKFLLV